MVEERMYLIDGITNCLMERGIFFRSFELNKFIEKVEATRGDVVGLIFKDNNVELLVEVSKEQAEKMIARETETVEDIVRC